VLCALAVMGTSAHALTLGEAQLQSGLGQPLRVQVPLVGAVPADLEARCFRVYRTAGIDNLPIPPDMRVELEQAGNVKRLNVRTRSVVQEPIIAFGIEVTCESSFRREYTLLLDPISPNEPIAAAVAPAPTLPALALPAQAGSASGGTPATDLSQGQGTPGVGRTSGAPSRPRADTAMRRKPSGNQTTSSEAAPPIKTFMRSEGRLSLRGNADSLSRDLDLTALASPRLRLSSALEFGGLTPPSATAPTEVERAVLKSKRDRLLATPIDDDLRPQLEVDLMIAQKRIAELQSRLASGDSAAAKTDGSPVAAAPTPAVTARPTVVATPPAAQTASSAAWVEWLKEWFWLPLLVGAIGLVGSYLWLQHQRRQEEADRSNASAAAAAAGLTPGESGDVAGGGFVDTKIGGAKTSTRVRVGKQTRVAAPPPLQRRDESLTGVTTIKAHGPLNPTDLSSEYFLPKFDASDVGVSMISAVTEEASVYVELGRIDEAIAVLKDHIDLERAYNRATPAPWLMLLDLFHRTNNRVDFEQMRTDFMKFFNGKVPEWGGFDGDNAEKSLLDHAHIIERLQKYWGTSKAHAYIQKLLYDHRDNARVGFSLQAYRELVLLDTIHNSAFPPVEQVEGVHIPA
jgi:pilus assembly protein FimV